MTPSHHSPWLALFQREWLQHRKGWALLAGVPFLLGLLLVSIGTVQVGADEATPMLPLAATVVAMSATMAIYVTLSVLTGIILLAGLARRDHGDRSVEFWLSLPTQHSAAWAVPLLTHAVLVPMAAAPLGALAGAALAPVLVSRIDTWQAWQQLPWAQLLPAAVAVVLRVMAGIPLALLWLSPVVMLMVALTAWMGRWGLLVLLGGFGIATAVLDKLWGTPWPAEALATLFENAGLSIMYAAKQPSDPPFSASNPIEAIGQVPGLLLKDFGQSLALLTEPALVPALLTAAACFGVVVFWRRRGAGTMG
jgi:ABC-2 type transport system permease protein